MLKVAIFTEGQSELIFVRYMLANIIGYGGLKVTCFRLHAEKLETAPYPLTCPNPKVDCLIINVENDERVLSAIKEREENLFVQGYHRIIGLRDMYSESYEKRSKGKIDGRVIQKFVDGAEGTKKLMSRPDSIMLHFAIMEWEAWVLGMYRLFQKIDDQLSLEYIERKLGMDLKSVDPQKKFYKPANDLGEILGLVGIDYKKSESNSEMICSKMTEEDFENAIEDGRCAAFKVFLDEIRSLSN